MAILSLGGHVSNRVRYYVSVNPVSETTRSRRAAKRIIFSERSGALRRAGPIVQCDPKKTA